MKHAARLTAILALIMPMTMVAACADTEWPQWISGEPTKAEINAYQGPIDMPPVEVENKPYPNLADVPQRPSIEMNAEQQQALREDMVKENLQGQANVAVYAAQQAAPPPVKKTPVKKKKKAKAKKPAVTQ